LNRIYEISAETERVNQTETETETHTETEISAETETETEIFRSLLVIDAHGLKIHEVFATFWEVGYIGVVKIFGGGYTPLMFYCIYITSFVLLVTVHPRLNVSDLLSLISRPTTQFMMLTLGVMFDRPPGYFRHLTQIQLSGECLNTRYSSYLGLPWFTYLT
jgi:hypothetical protein